ncbi:Ku protein, partial [Streptomyces pratensis]
TIEDLSGFHDEYREALEDIIAAKAEGTPVPTPAEGGEKEKGEVVDLMAALNASVTAAQESRGGGGEGASVHEMRPSKKTTRKTPAKKTAASKKSTASKKPAKKRSAS